MKVMTGVRKLALPARMRILLVQQSFGCGNVNKCYFFVLSFFCWYICVSVLHLFGAT